MAYDNQGAAVGAAGHYASSIVAALIEVGIVTTVDGALDTFTEVLGATFEACESLKGTLPEAPAPAKRSFGGRKSSGGGGGGDNADPATLVVNSGKYAGQTIAQIHANDPEYLDWTAENSKNDFLRGRVQEFLASVAA